MSQLLIQNIDPPMKVTDPWGCNRILSDVNLVMKWGHMTISKGGNHTFKIWIFSGGGVDPDPPVTPVTWAQSPGKQKDGLWRKTQIFPVGQGCQDE